MKELRKALVYGLASFRCNQVFVRVCFIVERWIFGSGTKLFVTGDEVVKPVVSVYPAVSRVQQQEENSLLCVARAMSPPLVRISWKRRMKNGNLEKLPSAEGKLLRLREPGCLASTLKIPQRQERASEYLCSVQHEGGTVETGPDVQAPTASSRPERKTTDLPALQTTENATNSSLPENKTKDLQLTELYFRSECRVRLLTLLYSVLVVKSLVYCCGLCLLTILTNNTPSIRRTTAP